MGVVFDAFCVDGATAIGIDDCVIAGWTGAGAGTNVLLAVGIGIKSGISKTSFTIVCGVVTLFI